jgi:tetratricopeptide (TPR) repeat protein
MAQRCTNCGKLLTSENCPRCTGKVVFRIVQKELALLVLLAAVAIPLFLFTRSMAARNRTMNVEMANSWYQQGLQNLRSGRTQEAIVCFRNATTNDHDNSEYMLALANALASADYVEEARQALLRLRTAEPESGEINLNLARLDAKEGKTGDAVRYYHNALYGMWPPDQMSTQRARVRIELVHYLLGAHDISRALSELLILSSDIPDTGAAHNNVGQLFLEAGDSQHALEQFAHALTINSRDPDALNGAGHATFNLGDYTKARRYLETAVVNGAKSGETVILLEVTRLVLSRDPLASNLGTDERIRRISENLSFASEALESCIDKNQGDEAVTAMLAPLKTEIDEGIQGPFSPRELRADPEGFRTGLNLIQRIEAATGQICSASSMDKALLLIGSKHGTSEQ